MITSISNIQMKNVIQLQKKSNARREQGLFVVEGMKMVKEAKEYGINKIYVSESFFQEKIKKESLFFREIPYEVVTDSVFKQISDTITPQGILAVVRKKNNTLERLIKRELVNFILLDDLRDPGNLGTIIRTAEGVGVTGVILSENCVDLYNPKVVRSTMGSIFRVPCICVESLIRAIKEMKEKGITIYAAHLKGTNYYDKEIYKKKSGIIIGNEGNGIKDEIVQQANICVKIPMEGNVESLNASIAASVFMYEIYRQRRNEVSIL